MSVRRRRDRTVSFRVSADEYEALSDYCSSVSARSISEFARSAVYQVMGSSNAGLMPLVSQLRVLVVQHSELRDKLTELSGRVDTWKREPAERQG